MLEFNNSSTIKNSPLKNKSKFSCKNQVKFMNFFYIFKINFYILL